MKDDRRHLYRPFPCVLSIMTWIRGFVNDLSVSRTDHLFIILLRAGLPSPARSVYHPAHQSGSYPPCPHCRQGSAVRQGSPHFSADTASTALRRTSDHSRLPRHSLWPP